MGGRTGACARLGLLLRWELASGRGLSGGCSLSGAASEEQQPALVGLERLSARSEDKTRDVEGRRARTSEDLLWHPSVMVSDCSDLPPVMAVFSLPLQNLTPTFSTSTNPNPEPFGEEDLGKIVS